MNFRRGRLREDPEMNLVPLIDVLLVILIFLMVSTTYSKFAGMEISLPTADAPPTQETPSEINVTVTAEGEVAVNRRPVGSDAPAAIADALERAAGPRGDPGKAPVVIINADAKAAHQRVIDVMQAAQQAGLTHISFATQQKRP